MIDNQISYTTTNNLILNTNNYRNNGVDSFVDYVCGSLKNLNEESLTKLVSEAKKELALRKLKQVD
jgi:hypothetical protein